MPATGWNSHDAAMLVARQQHIPAAERRQMLEALGLLDDTGTGIRADRSGDQERAIAVGIAVLNDSAVRMRYRTTATVDTPPTLGGQYCPPGLRHVIQGGEPVRSTEAPKPQPAPQPSVIPAPNARGRHNGQHGRPRQPCGKPSGVKAHTRRGEPICDLCREAKNRKRQQYRKEPTGPRLPASTPCGTLDGYTRHRQQKKTVCDACRAAREAVYGPPKVRTILEPGVGRGHGGRRAACGTSSGGRGHRRRHEAVCDACHEAERQRSREWRQRTYVPHPRPPRQPCGTAAGYSRHQRAKEKICDPCRAAHNAKRTQERADRRQQQAGEAA